MIRKSIVNRPADLLDDYILQWRSVMMASDRANPSCEQKQVGKSILKKKKKKSHASAQIPNKESFINKSMDKNCYNCYKCPMMQF